MTGIYEHSLSAYNCKQRPASEYFVPFVAGQVCEACAIEGHVGAAPNGFRIEENQFTTEEISAEQIEQARRAIARFHEIRRTMTALGVMDEFTPAPSSTRVVDEGLLQRYEQELTDARMNTIVATRAANDMRRVFLSDKEIQNAESDPESWEIAVTRAEQIRDQLDELSPGLDLMVSIEEVKRENQTIKRERDRAHAAVDELEQQLTEWKERARTAERGQPKFSRPSPPADEPKDES